MVSRRRRDSPRKRGKRARERKKERERERRGERERNAASRCAAPRRENGETNGAATAVDWHLDSWLGAGKTLPHRAAAYRPLLVPSAPLLLLLLLLRLLLPVHQLGTTPPMSPSEVEEAATTTPRRVHRAFPERESSVDDPRPVPRRCRLSLVAVTYLLFFFSFSSRNYYTAYTCNTAAPLL